MSRKTKELIYEKIKAYVLEKYGLKAGSLYIAQGKDKCGLDKRLNYNLSKKDDPHAPECPKDGGVRMILESLQSANSTMLDSVQATSNKQAAKAFKDQVIALSQCTPQLEQLLNLIKAMQEKKISSKVFTVEIKDSLQDAVDTCGQKTYNHTLDVSAVTALKNAIELCRKNVDITWKEFANDLSNDVENSLTSLKGLLQNKQEAEDLLEALQKAKVSIPGSSKAIDTFLENVKRGKSLIDGLHLDEEAEKFIVKVRAQQATVADLSPHIMDWLKENHLTGQIKVRF